MDETFSFGPFFVSAPRRELWANGQRVSIGPRALDLLIVLLRRPGEVVSKTDLIEAIWSGAAVEDNAITAQVSALRRALRCGEDGARYVQTVPGRGYRFVGIGTEVAVTTAPLSPGAHRQRLAMRRSWTIVALAGAAAVAAIGWTELVQRRPADWTLEGLRMLPVVSQGGTYPALSHDGSMIAYAAEARGGSSRHIFVRDAATGGALQLTQGDNVDIAPSWSPSGETIAFVRYRPSRPCEILVKPLLAGRETHLADCATDERTEPAWSPDGKTLYWLDRAGPGAPERIVALDLGSGKKRGLAVVNPTPWLFFHEIALSPDGRFMASVQSEAGRWALWTIDLKSGERRRIADKLPNVGGLAWSSDGTTLFAAVHRMDDSAIWAFPLVGSPAKRLTVGPLEIGRLGGADGKLAAEITSVRFSVAQVGAPRAGPNGETHAGLPIDFDVSNNGRMAVVVYLDGRFQIWTRRPRGPWADLPGLEDSAAVGVRWSPDGETLAFEAAGSRGNGVFVSTSDTPGRLIFAAPLDKLHPPAWSPDGGTLIIPVLGAKGWSLWRVDPTKSHASPVTGHDGYCGVHATDGDVFGSKPNEPGIWRLGRPDELVTNALPAGHCSDWTAGAATLVFRDFRDPTSSQLIVHHLASGLETSAPAPQVVTFDQGAEFSAGLPGGRTFYLRSSGTSQIAVMKVARRG